MKKFILWATIIITAVLIIVGLAFTYWAAKNQNPKPIVQIMAEALGRKFNLSAESLSVNVLSDTGLFAKGTYNETGGGGGIWFAAKTQNGWELAGAGNGIISCGDIEKYDFPREMIPQCIDTQNGNNLIQR